VDLVNADRASAAPSTWQRAGAIVATALAFALYTRVELPWAVLGWVALVPWLATLDREHRMRDALWSGVAMSIAFTLAVFAWFASAIARYAGVPPLAGYALLVLAAPLLQPQFVVFAGVRHAVGSRGGGRLRTSVAAASAWVGAEWLLPRLFGDTIGHGVYAFPTLRQGADLAGAAGLTFILLLVNEAGCDALARWRRSAGRAVGAAAVAGGLVAALAMYGAVRIRQLETTPQSQPPFTALLVQANLEDYGGLRERRGAYGAVRRVLDVYEAMSTTALDRAPAPPELLVWPETVYPTTFGDPKSDAAAALDDDIVAFAASAGVPLFFGTYDRDAGREYNAAVLLQPDASNTASRDVYRKRRLFPLTEEVPAWLDTEPFRALLPWLGTWCPGDGPPILALRRRGGGELRLAPLVCRDAVDPTLALDAARRGADVIVTLSNDGWFAGEGGAELHLVVSAFRSIETRLPQIRATNGGISAVVTPTGEIVARSSVERPAVIAATVSPGGRPTPMTRWGDWFGPTACLVALLMGATALRRPRGA